MFGIWSGSKVVDLSERRLAGLRAKLARLVEEVKRISGITLSVLIAIL
jgi:hypothetical protein